MRPGVVVAIEFTGLGPEHSFDRLLGPAASIRIDPLDFLTERLRSLPEQATALLDRLDEPPRVVIGHCTAARLAVRLAAVAAAADRPPSVVLLDPDPVRAAYLDQEFAAMCSALGGPRPGPVPPDRSGPPSPARLAAMEAELARLAGGLSSAYGGDADAEEVVGELLTRYAAWLRFLAAGCRSGPVRFSGEVVTICSTGSPAGLNDIISCDRITCLPGCAPAGTALLSSPAARAAVQLIISGGRPQSAVPSSSLENRPTSERCSAHVQPDAPSG